MSDLFSISLLQPSLSLSSVALYAAVLLVSVCAFFVLRTWVSNVLHYYSGVHLLPRPFQGHNLFRLLYLSDPLKFVSLIHACPHPVSALNGPMHIHNVFLTSAAAIRQVSVTRAASFDKPAILKRFARDFAGDESIFNATGKQHRTLRQLISSCLTYEQLTNEYQVSFKQNAKQLCEQLDGSDVVLSIRRATFKVIVDVCFGNEFVDDQSFEELLQLYHTSLTTPKGIYLVILLMRVFVPFIPAALFVPSERVKPVLRKRVEGICQRVIDSKQLHTNSLLSRMLHGQKDGRTITSEELTHIVLTLLLAGQATTTISFSWLLHSLASHPELQTKLFEEELRDIDLDSPTLLDDLLQCKYLDNVVSETLRMYPPLSYMLREVTEPKGVEVDGHHLPKGTFVRIPTLALQLVKDVWGADADVFNPSRFEIATSQQVMTQRKWYNSTFWFGGHGCIGQRFAILEMKVFAVHIIKAYKVTGNREGLDKVHRFGTDTTPRGLELSLVPRE